MQHSNETNPVEHRPRPEAPVAAPRYHALDCVRAAAMFLGIFYHLQFFNTGGGGFWPGSGGPPPFNPKGTIDAWLHSFRMPLFFLISGFFANMVLAKYGLWKYLTRRWWRIGAPLLVAFLGFGLVRTYFPQVASAAFGGMTFVAPPPKSGTSPASPSSGTPSSSLPAGGEATKPAAPVPMPVFKMPAMPSNTWLDAMLGQANALQDWILEKAPWLGDFLSGIGGQKARLTVANFHFEHLWFLWYLLVFVTIGPFLALLMGWLFRKQVPQLDRFGRGLLRFNLGACLLGIAALPAALGAAGFDWGVQPPAGFFATLPDCFVEYYSDLPLYLVYFLAGWWFFRLRAGLPDVARFWLWNLTLGVVGFSLSQSLFRAYGFQFGHPHYTQYRLIAFALYAVGAAFSGFGLLGLFQRYLDRPTTLGKYFTDTILWIYLVQLAIIPHVLPWIQSERTTWWAASLAGMVAVTAVALVLFELIVRPTPLVHIFGAPGLSRGRRGPAPAATQGADTRPDSNPTA